MTGKNDIRRRMRRQRRALSREQRHRASEQVAASLGSMHSFCGARRIAIYAANDGEIDLCPAAKRFCDKRYYLPVVPPPGKRRMLFACLGPDTSFTTNRYGILEPDVPAGSLLTGRELDLVLAPLVAFDRLGGRLGMGGGYYDATFEFLAERTHWLKPKIIGVAFSFQEVPRIERDPWDIPLWAVATERGSISMS